MTISGCFGEYHLRMLFSIILEKLYHLSSAEIIWNLLIIFIISVIVRMSISIINYATWRRKISKTIPSTKMRFLNILGNVSDLPFTKKSRNGQSVLVYLQQLLLSHAKLLENEKLYSLWLFFHPVIVLSKPEAIEAIYSGMQTIDKGLFYIWAKPFFGNGVLTSSGDRWRSDRKMLNHCFRSDILKEHIQMMNEKSRILVNRLRGETEKDFSIISKYLGACTFDVICEAIYGIDVEAQQPNKESAVFLHGNIGFRLVTRRFLNIFLWPDLLFNFSKTGKETKRHSEGLRNFVRDLIEKEEEKFSEPSQPSEKRGKSLVKLLLEQYYLSKNMTEEDIRDQLITFMIAGQDTTKISLNWILYMVGLHPEIQAKVYEELELIFGDDHERDATAKDLKNMKYLECVIKETLRLYPPVTLMAREVNEDTTICGYQIPKGTTCLAFPLVLHRDESEFPNPEKFDPDRFLPENSANRHPCAWIPFSAGPRNCIGQKLALLELLTVLSTVLRWYTVESLDPRDKVLPALTIGLTSSIPLRIRIRPRR